MDALTRCIAPASKIRLNYVEVTETAKALERRHLSGPSAAQILGEALAGVALLSADLGKEDERITLQMQVSGPVGGYLAEASADGSLRGYTNEKILHQYDGCTLTDTTPLVGAKGRMTVLQSTSERLVYSAQVTANPPTIRTCVARYLNDSQQTPAAVTLAASTQEGYLHHASGLVAERMPDGDVSTFVKVLERFDDGSAHRAIENGESIGELRQLLGLDDLEVSEVRNLHFYCACSQEKILGVLSTLAEEELRDIVGTGEAQHVTCHFCGETYIVPAEGMKTLLQQKLMNDSSKS